MNSKAPKHYSQTLLDEARISEAIAQENDEWIIKQMLKNKAESRLIERYAEDHAQRIN